MFFKTRVALIFSVLFLLILTIPSFSQPIVYLPTNITTDYNATNQNVIYQITGTCTVSNNAMLYVGEGCTIRANTMFMPLPKLVITDGAMLLIDGESDNRVTIYSNTTTRWLGIQFTSTASTYGFIKYCDISDAEVGIDMDVYVSSPANNFYGIDFDNCGYGIQLEDCEGMAIGTSNFTNCTYGVYGYNVDPDISSVGVSVYQCDFEFVTHPIRVQYSGYVFFSGKIIGGSNGVYTRYCEGLSIDHDYEYPSIVHSLIDNVTSYGVYAYRVPLVDIEQLDVDGRDNTNYGIYINNYNEATSDIEIQFTQTYDLDYTGTRILNCDEVYFYDLNSYYNHRYGLHLTNVDDLTGIYNSSLHRNDYHGLFMYNVSAQDYYDGCLYESYVGLNDDHGILIEDSYLNIYESSVKANGQYGVYVYDGVELDVMLSQIVDNGDEGIRVNTSAYDNELVDIQVDSSDIVGNDAGASSDQIYSWIRGLDIHNGYNYIYSSTTTWEISGPRPATLFGWACRNNYWGEWPNSPDDVVNPACAPGGISYISYLLADPGWGPFPEDPGVDATIGSNAEQNDPFPRDAETHIDLPGLRGIIVNQSALLEERLAALNTYSRHSERVLEALAEIKSNLPQDSELYSTVNNRMASAHSRSCEYQEALNLYAENFTRENQTAHALNILNSYYMWAEQEVLNSEVSESDYVIEMDKAFAELPLIPGTEAYKPTTFDEYQLIKEMLESNSDAELSSGEVVDGRISDYKLEAPYPNPFNPNVTIPFSLPDVAEIKVEVYNVLGEKVATLANGNMEAGKHQLIWNGVDSNGKLVASGIYYVKMKAADFNQTSRIVFMK